MAEFVNLTENDSIEVIRIVPIIDQAEPVNPDSIKEVKLDSIIVDGSISEEELTYPTEYNVITIDQRNSEAEIVEEAEECACDIEQFYGESTTYFEREKLLSEIKNEYERAVIRRNLGIAEAYAMKWGNITGNILNQTDLYDFVVSHTTEEVNSLIAEINLKLANWAYEINQDLSTKAPIESPILTGIPESTLPALSSNSNQIATTQWVNSRLGELALNTGLKSLSISPEYIMLGDTAVNVVCTWNYINTIISQSINDIVLNPSIRTYTFNNINTNTIFTLRYSDGAQTYTENVSFTVKTPIYYGKSLESLIKTINTTVTVTSGTGEYIYILLPNISNAVFTVGGFEGGIVLYGTQTLNSIVYYVYRSVNTNLGKTTIKIEW